MLKTDVLIVGAGVAGLSTAYFLGAAGGCSVMVIEQEKKLGGHASGRNAGMLRQALSDPVLVTLAKRSRKYFDSLEKKGWENTRLVQNGSLLLSNAADKGKLKEIAEALKKNKIKSIIMTKEEAEKKVPLLKDGHFSEALFCSSDAMLDLEPFLKGFLKNLKKMNIPVYRGMVLKRIKTEKDGFRVEAGNKIFFTQRIVNAAGAWAPWVAEKAGALPIPLKSYRRHLFLSRPPSLVYRPSSIVPRPSSANWPFVWDISHNFYFRPVNKDLLLSPCDKTFEKNGNRLEKVNPAMKKILSQKLAGFSTPAGKVRFGKAKSGLRSMVPDGRFVIGEDPKREGFFWVTGLGGHGVTTCFAVGELAANLILKREVDSQLAKALSPRRFL